MRTSANLSGTRRASSASDAGRTQLDSPRANLGSTQQTVSPEDAADLANARSLISSMFDDMEQRLSEPMQPAGNTRPQTPTSAVERTSTSTLEQTSTVEQEPVATHTETRVETVAAPKNRELEAAREAGNAGWFANLSAGERSAVAKFFLDVVNNEFALPAARVAASIFNIALRNAPTVGLPTAIRQTLAHFIGNDPKKIDEIAGYLLSGMPIALETGGLLLDRYKQRDTALTRTSRLAMIGVSVASLAAAAKTPNGADGAGPTSALTQSARALAVFYNYCANRDFAQRVLQLKDQLPGIDMVAVMIAGLFYGGNQTVVNLAMAFFASPSGQGTMSLEMGNNLLRALFNWAGETVDDTVLGALQAWRQGVPFQTRLAPQRPSGEDLLNTTFGQFAARVTVFGAAVLLSQVFVAKTAELSPEAQKIFSSILGGGILGALYSLFVGTLKTEVRTPIRIDPEAPAVAPGGVRSSGRPADEPIELERMPAALTGAEVPNPEPAPMPQPNVGNQDGAGTTGAGENRRTLEELAQQLAPPSRNRAGGQQRTDPADVPDPNETAASPFRLNVEIPDPELGALF